MTFESRAGAPVEDLPAWQRCIAEKDWKPGRSAWELANAWLLREGAEQARAAIATNDGLADIAFELGVIEAQTRFDAFGGPRNHDLLVTASADGESSVVSVEGKGDETFGQTVSQYQAAADKKVAAEKPTNAPARLAGLVDAICGYRTLDDERILELRFQLFSGLAGTLAAAADTSAAQGVFLVHEFATAATHPAKRRINAMDLWKFTTAVLDFEVPLEGAWCVGPFTVPGDDRLPGGLPLWLAHVTS